MKNSRQIFKQSTTSLYSGRCMLLNRNQLTSSTMWCTQSRRDFSINRACTEKQRTLWGNIMEFVNTLKAGRRMKKVEEEMKENYTRLVASTLLEVRIKLLSNY